MVRDTVRHLRAQGRHVFFDAEHFFDGYLGNADFAIRVLEAAAEEGAERLVLCDTNGGTLPSDVARIVGRSASASTVSRSGSTRTTMPGARWRRPSPVSRPGSSRSRVS